MHPCTYRRRRTGRGHIGCRTRRSGSYRSACSRIGPRTRARPGRSRESSHRRRVRTANPRCPWSTRVRCDRHLRRSRPCPRRRRPCCLRRRARRRASLDRIHSRHTRARRRNGRTRRSCRDRFADPRNARRSARNRDGTRRPRSDCRKRRAGTTPAIATPMRARSSRTSWRW